MTEQKEARYDPGPPPYYGYKQVEGAPYPMTDEEFWRWPREPGYKYELHAGMCARLWVGPFAFYGGFALLRGYQYAERRYLITVPDLPGCETEVHTSGSPDGRTWLEAFEQSMQQGAAAIDRWVQAAQATGTPIPLPRTLEAPPEEPSLKYLEEPLPLAHLRTVDLIPIGTQGDYILALSAQNGMRERVGDDKTHPLAALLDALAEQIAAYEQEQHPI